MNHEQTLSLWQFSFSFTVKISSSVKASAGDCYSRASPKVSLLLWLLRDVRQAAGSRWPVFLRYVIRLRCSFRMYDIVHYEIFISRNMIFCIPSGILRVLLATILTAAGVLASLGPQLLRPVTNRASLVEPFNCATHKLIKYFLKNCNKSRTSARILLPFRSAIIVILFYLIPHSMLTAQRYFN